MKRLTIFILVIALALILCGCSTSPAIASSSISTATINSTSKNSMYKKYWVSNKQVHSTATKNLQQLRQSSTQTEKKAGQDIFKVYIDNTTNLEFIIYFDRREPVGYGLYKEEDIRTEEFGQKVYLAGTNEKRQYLVNAGNEYLNAKNNVVSNLNAFSAHDINVRLNGMPIVIDGRYVTLNHGCIRLNELVAFARAYNFIRNAKITPNTYSFEVIAAGKVFPVEITADDQFGIKRAVADGIEIQVENPDRKVLESRPSAIDFQMLDEYFDWNYSGQVTEKCFMGEQYITPETIQNVFGWQVEDIVMTDNTGASFVNILTDDKDVPMPELVKVAFPLWERFYEYNVDVVFSHQLYYRDDEPYYDFPKYAPDNSGPVKVRTSPIQSGPYKDLRVHDPDDAEWAAMSDVEFGIWCFRHDCDAVLYGQKIYETNPEYIDRMCERTSAAQFNELEQLLMTASDSH